MLKFTESTVRTVRSDHLDAFITKSYGREYHFVSAEETTNDTQHRFTVEGEYSAYQTAAIGRWLDGDDYEPPALYLLNDLARRSMIPAGVYLVEVSW